MYNAKRTRELKEEICLKKDQAVLKLGTLCVVSGDSKHNAHIHVVRDDLATTAKFYSDSNKTIWFGSLSVSKCNFSLSDADLSTIQVSRQSPEIKRRPGLLLRAKSHADAVKWLQVLDGAPEQESNEKDA